MGFPSNPNIKLQPGDHINVFPENDPKMVVQIIKRLAQVPKENEIVELENNINEFVFKLYDGYKLSITLNNELEKLEFTNYTINFKK